jgi:hypothetical protein
VTGVDGYVRAPLVAAVCGAPRDRQ